MKRFSPKLLLTPGFLIMILLSPLISKGQNKYNYNSPGQDCFCEFMYHSQSEAPKAVIIMDTEGEDLALFKSSNEIVQSDLFHNYAFVFIKIINQGYASKERCLEVVAKRATSIRYINPELVFLVKKWVPTSVHVENQPSSDYAFRTIWFSGQSFDELYSELNKLSAGKPYIVRENFTNNERLYNLKMTNYAKNFDLSIFLAPMILTGNQFGFERNAITSYGLTFSKNFRAQQTIRFSAGASLKVPDQEGIQSGIQSDVQTAVFAGDDSLDISEEIKSHVLFFFQLDYRYYLHRERQLRWFIGAGLGITNATVVKGSIEETLDLTDVDTSDPSSFQDIIDPDDFSPDLEQNNQRYLHSVIDLGFQYRMTPGAKFEASLPVRNYFKDSFNSTGNMSIGLNLSLVFTINPGKIGQVSKIDE